MTTLRLLSLVLIAGICVSIFAIVYPHLQDMWRAQQARDAAFSLASNINQVISDGNPRKTELSLPPGYTLSLKNIGGAQKIVVDGMRFPEGEFELPVEFDNFTELAPGDHELYIGLKSGKVLVTKVG